MNEKADYPRAGKWFSANSYLSFIFRLAECIFQPMEYKTFLTAAGKQMPYAA